MKERYKSNEELVLSMKESFNEDMFLELLRRFHPLVKKYSQYYLIPSFDKDDYQQLANITMFNAIDKFDIETCPYFAPYFKRAYINKLKNEIRRLSAKRRGSDTKTLLMADFIAEGDAKPLYRTVQVPPSQVAQMHQIYHQLIRECSQLEKETFIYFLDGKSNEEIAEIMGVRPRNVQDSLYRVRLKLRQLCQENCSDTY